MYHGRVVTMNVGIIGELYYIKIIKLLPIKLRLLSMTKEKLL